MTYVTSQAPVVSVAALGCFHTDIPLYPKYTWDHGVALMQVKAWGKNRVDPKSRGTD